MFCKNILAILLHKFIPFKLFSPKTILQTLYWANDRGQKIC